MKHADPIGVRRRRWSDSVSTKNSVLADIAEGRDEIDVEAAKTEQAEATKLLGEWKGSEEEFEAEVEKLEKAQARLDLSGT